MSEAFVDHQEALLTAFGQVLQAEQAVSSVKTALAEAEAQLKVELSEREMELGDAWRAVEGLLAETGEFEVTLPGASSDYRIYRSRPRESVKVDAEAVPEEWSKVERKPKLKEISDHLRAIQALDQPLPNWARFEVGESKLQYRLVKKTAR